MNTEINSIKNNMFSVLSTNFIILDKITQTIFNRFQNPDIKINKNSGEIIFKINDEYTATSDIDFTSFYVITRVTKNDVITVAENHFGYDGYYREIFTKLDKEIRSIIFDWFTDISNIKLEEEIPDTIIDKADDKIIDDIE